MQLNCILANAPFLARKITCNLQAALSKSRNCGLARYSMQTSTAGDDWDLTDAGRRELKDLEGKWSRICVLGGSKGVGREIVSLLSARGVNVVALVRKEESKAELDALPGVTSVVGDALEASDVISVLDGDDLLSRETSALPSRLPQCVCRATSESTVMNPAPHPLNRDGDAGGEGAGCDAAISTLGGVTDDVRVDYKVLPTEERDREREREAQRERETERERAGGERERERGE